MLPFVVKAKNLFSAVVKAILPRSFEIEVPLVEEASIPIISSVKRTWVEAGLRSDESDDELLIFHAAKRHFESVSSPVIINRSFLLVKRYLEEDCCSPPLDSKRSRNTLNVNDALSSQEEAMTTTIPLNTSPNILFAATPSPKDSENQPSVPTSPFCFPPLRDPDELTPIHIYEDPETPQIPIAVTNPKGQSFAIEESGRPVEDRNVYAATPSPKDSEDQQSLTTSSSFCFPPLRDPDELTPIHIYEDPETPQIPIAAIDPKEQSFAIEVRPVEDSTLYVATPSPKDSENQPSVPTSPFCFPPLRDPDELTPIHIYEDPETPQILIAVKDPKRQSFTIEESDSPVEEINKKNSFDYAKFESSMKAIAEESSSPEQVSDTVEPFEDIEIAAQVLCNMEGIRLPISAPDGTKCAQQSEKHTAPQVLPNIMQVKRRPLADITMKTLDESEESTAILSQSKEHSQNVEGFARQSQLLPQNPIISSKVEEPKCLGHHMIDSDDDENLFWIPEGGQTSRKRPRQVILSSTEDEEIFRFKIIKSSPLFDF